MQKETSNGLSADYYLVPDACKTFADLALHKEMEVWQSKLFLRTWAYVFRTHKPNPTQRMPLDGSLPKVAITDLSDLLCAYNVNHCIGEVLCELYRFHEVSHSGGKRGINKISTYLDREMSRVNQYDPRSFASIHDLITLFCEVRQDSGVSRNGRGEWTP